MSTPREIFFHEDDYCQQQLLPRAATDYADAEVRKLEEFADAHRAPGGLGWTAMYVPQKEPVEFRALKISREMFADIVSPILTPYDVVYTGYSSHREQCTKTAAWGRSEQCALLACWDDDGIIAEVWAEFFEPDDASILAATQAVAALGKLYPLVYVDWAWGYSCDASDQDAFASKLRTKLNTIADRMKTFPTG